jgi:hypothetical protein
MKYLTARSVSAFSAFVLAAALPVMAAPPSVSAAAAPAYNASLESHFTGVITGVRGVADGPFAGVHLTVQNKSKNETADVFLAPSAFLKIFRTNFPVGAAIQVTGSPVKMGEAQTVLAREVTEGDTSITLRDFGGEPVWEHWGAPAASTAAIGG